MLARIMSNKPSSAEPPSKYACHVDVQCFYADVTVPDDQIFQCWASAVINFLVRYELLDNQNFELFILIVDEAESRFLNNEFRQKDSTTNVLSFPFETPEVLKQHQLVNTLGDIVICAPIIELESRQQKKSIEEHWAHMLVHGVLHLLGYDHINNKDASIMESLEIKILSELNYQDPYMELTHE